MYFNYEVLNAGHLLNEVFLQCGINACFCFSNGSEYFLQTETTMKE